MVLLSPVYRIKAFPEEEVMNFKFTLIVFALISMQVSAFATDVCTCNGLASNFPGVSLVCDHKIIDRTPFIDGDETLAGEVCGADRTLYLGGVVQSVGSCSCADDQNGSINLLMGASQSLHDYRYLFTNAPGSRDDALGSCQQQLSELERVDICSAKAQ
jgi:hypothetical protein